MEAITILLLIWLIPSIVFLAFLVFVIIKGVGLKNLFTIFKVKLKLRKGWGTVLMYQKTGHPKLIPIKFEGEMLEPMGKNKGRYVYKNYCVYTNTFGIPEIAYREDDSDPIDPRTGIQNNTSPIVLENILAKALKAESTYAGDWVSFLKEHWLKILLFYLGPLCILGFIVLQQQDTIANLASRAGQQIILNGTAIGR